MTKPLTLIQISDAHLLPDSTQYLRGENPWYNLQRVLEQVKSHSPDGLLLTGDLADGGSAIAYKNLQKAMAEFDCPIYWLHGNHDDINQLKCILTPSQPLGYQTINLGSWRLLLLDSVLISAKFGEGYLPEVQLQWLEKELQQHPHKPTIITLHHHPIPTGIDWVDQIGVKNGTDLVRLLDSFSQVRFVLFGHIHHALHHRHSHIDFFGCPSTFSQVIPPKPSLNDHLPGFRLIHLWNDGHFHTQVERINQ
ncbi:metallophosphoesterase [Cyanobacterium stanieri PCC 7202]|uniref:Metallophosphoesterase n=1 Tax=Cyanobacterium stanieri (strain ATCC 29140 / PCC 7202) TaxID=292563 RepID=K9YN17_CYASC|nr:metallophosphoesterase [Cyanobacterium stanieri PCC 7202]